MTAQVTIVLRSAEDVLTLPASVLTRKDRQGNYIVEVWNEQAKAADAKAITIGLNNKITAEVTSGLGEGDLVVASGTTAVAAGTGSGQRSSTRNLLSGGGAGAGGPPPF